MSAVRSAYAEAAAAAVTLLTEPAVAAAWDQPSALPHWRVGGLAGHLARQVTSVPLVLGQRRRGADHPAGSLCQGELARQRAGA